jgi:hypothetical protein
MEYFLLVPNWMNFRVDFLWEVSPFWVFHLLEVLRHQVVAVDLLRLPMLLPLDSLYLKIVVIG